MALEHIKSVVATAALGLKSVAIYVARIGSNFDRHKNALAQVSEDIERDLNVVKAALIDLNDERRVVVGATSAADVNAPLEAISSIDMAIAQVEEMRDLMMQMRESIRVASLNTSLVTDRASAGFMHVSQATSVLDRWRTSF